MPFLPESWHIPSHSIYPLLPLVICPITKVKEEGRLYQPPTPLLLLPLCHEGRALHFWVFLSLGIWYVAMPETNARLWSTQIFKCIWHLEFGLNCFLSIFRKKKKLENKSKVSIALSISKVTSQQDEPQCPAHNIPWQVWRFDALMVCACVCVYVHSVSECVCPVTF